MFINMLAFNCCGVKVKIFFSILQATIRGKQNTLGSRISMAPCLFCGSIFFLATMLIQGLLNFLLKMPPTTLISRQSPRGKQFMQSAETHLHYFQLKFCYFLVTFFVFFLELMAKRNIISFIVDSLSPWIKMQSVKGAVDQRVKLSASNLSRTYHLYIAKV